MDRISSLPEDCLSDILSRTSPLDASRSAVISSVFKSAADSDSTWNRWLPSDHLEIVARSVSLVPLATKKQLYCRLANFPILLDDGNLSFALDKESGKKCCMLGARMLYIIWGSSPEYWKWTSSPQSRFPEVAVLLKVCWLDIGGEIGTRTLLSPMTTYVAYLVFTIEEDVDDGFDIPLEASVTTEQGDEFSDVYLKLPGAQDGRIPHMRKDGLMEVELGEFFNDGDNGVVKIRLRETEQLHWKSGLTVEGIELRPKVDA